jgi:serine/threonine protein kinase
MDAGRSGGGKPTDILPAGAVIAGKYRVERALGAGAMGAVFVAVHTGTGRKVALKVVTGEIAREDLVARFQREARAAGVIETQHITQVLDTGVDQATGLPFLVMELLQGEDVQQLLKRNGPLPPDLALRIVAQACLGLQKAHEANVVHRDIKPANLFLARRDAGEIIIKLLDFGIAKVMMEHSQDAEGASMTRTGSMLGSPLYMSPEQARGVKDIDHRADVWSLGIVLYQALSGKTPYHHITALGELIIAICSIPPQPIQEIAPWVPRDVAAIVHWALRIDRNERFQSAQAMFQAVRALLPYGWNIGDEMIVPLSDAQRMQRETALSTSQMNGPAPVGVPTGRHLAASQIGSGSLAPPPVVAGARTIDPATTTSALTQSQVAGATSSSKVPLIAAAVVALGILAGGGVYFVAGSPKPPTDTTTQAALPAPQPTVAPTAAPTVAPAAPVVEERRVKLVVLPMDASVEIDGQPVTVKDGIVELSGGLGVTRSVRVFKGGSETIEDVAITDMGPLPPKVELTLKRVPGKPGTPGQPGTPTQPPGHPTTTPAPGIKDRFE